MVNFTNFSRIATAAVAAIVISSACVAAAVGPATSPAGETVYVATQLPVAGQATA